MVGEVEVVVVLELELVEIRLFFPAGEETKGDADRLWLDEEEEDDDEEEEDEDEGVNRTLKAKLGLSVGRVLKVSASLALKICMMLDLIFLPLTYTPLVLFKSLQ